VSPLRVRAQPPSPDPPNRPSHIHKALSTPAPFISRLPQPPGSYLATEIQAPADRTRADCSTHRRGPLGHAYTKPPRPSRPGSIRIAKEQGLRESPLQLRHVVRPRRAPKQPEPAGPVSTSAATASLRRPAPPTHHARPSAEDRRPQPSDRFRVKRRPERYSRHAAMDEFQPSRLVCVSRVLPAGTRSAAVALCFGLPVRRLRSCRVEAGPLRRPRSLSVTQPGEQNGEQIETKSQYPRNTESLS